MAESYKKAINTEIKNVASTHVTKMYVYENFYFYLLNKDKYLFYLLYFSTSIALINL